MEDLPHVAGMANRKAFATTHWSVVLAAGEKGSAEAAAALAELCRAYWYPLYAYLRRKCYDRDAAQDLTQEFFTRFLERNSFGLADRRRGRFRTFLLASLEHFLAKEWNRERRLKRGGGRTFISWEGEDAEARYGLESPGDWSAERIYERRWALTVLEEAMRALEAEYAKTGRLPLFQALKPLLSGEPAELSYRELACRLEMSEGALRVAVHRLRQRYGDCVRAEIAKVVQRPQEVEEEVQHLFSALG
jgi:RNA polymerase sigma factor (sigma-70 family)